MVNTPKEDDDKPQGIDRESIDAVLDSTGNPTSTTDKEKDDKILRHLQFADDSLKKDKEVVLAAIRNTGFGAVDSPKADKDTEEGK